MIMREEPLNYDGDLYKLERGFTLRFKPFRPHIPIHLASVTPKSVRQTAEIADGWIPIFLPQSQWKPQLDAFYGYVAETGRDRSEVDVRNPVTVTVTADQDAARQTAGSAAAFYIARMGDFYYEHFTRMGFADEANAVRRAWSEGGSTAGIAALPADLVEELTIAGSVGECVDAMEQAAEAGFTLHSVNVQEPDPKKRYEIFRELVG
jgi:alkanesulfonate monooxygenase SsuD/methylene tetrahydromethanopterin reductase-like flavin-dependent oxidoreductase (luciferase family)